MAEALKKFLSELATDHKRLGAFISDPDAEMDAAGLDATDKSVLKSGNINAIHYRLISQDPPMIVVIVGAEAAQARFPRAVGPGTSHILIAPPTVVVVAGALAQPSPHTLGMPAQSPNMMSPTMMSPTMMSPMMMAPMMMTPMMMPPSMMFSPMMFSPTMTPMMMPFPSPSPSPFPWMSTPTMTSFPTR